MARIKMICLANSRKIGGRCVAGVRTDGGGWVRPIADRESGTLLVSETKLHDGTEARVLDVVVIDVVEPRPDRVQPENYLLGDGLWRLLSRPAAGRELRRLDAQVVEGPDLLGSRTDRVAAADFDLTPNGASLALVRPQAARWRRTTDYHGRQRVRAVFELGGLEYDLSLTDPVWEAKLMKLSEGLHVYEGGDLLFTISLGEPLNGICYKFVVGVVALPDQS